MGHKIFISYKYHDSNVKKVTNKHYGEDTARDYVNLIAKYLNDKSDHIYKGESDGEDLSQLSDDSIWSTLKDRIYDSSLTLVLVSPGMKDNTSEKKSVDSLGNFIFFKRGL